VGFWISSSLILAALKFVLRLATLDMGKSMEQLGELKKTLGFMVPDGPVEILAFVALTMTAGFCEEVIYRGYFQQPFRAWTNNLALTIVAQGILFGG